MTPCLSFCSFSGPDLFHGLTGVHFKGYIHIVRGNISAYIKVAYIYPSGFGLIDHFHYLVMGHNSKNLTAKRCIGMDPERGCINHTECHSHVGSHSFSILSEQKILILNPSYQLTRADQRPLLTLFQKSSSAVLIQYTHFGGINGSLAPDIDVITDINHNKVGILIFNLKDNSKFRNGIIYNFSSISRIKYP